MGNEELKGTDRSIAELYLEKLLKTRKKIQVNAHLKFSH